jgi:alkylhydroperoxidase family enzyme
VKARLAEPPEPELAAKEALSRSKVELGAAPAPLRALSQAPLATAGVWMATHGILLEGRVPRTTKLLVALAAVSVSPGAESLRGVFRSALASVEPAILDDLEKRGESGRLPERTQRVIAFARRAALAPAQLTDEDFALLRRSKLANAEIAELVALGGLLALWIAIARATRA